MTEREWLACGEPDLLLEELEGTVSRGLLVEFVRRCWAHITPPVDSAVSVVDQFVALAPHQSDHDAVVYAAEAALKAAGWAASLKEEQRYQAALLRGLVGRKPAPVWS